MKYLLLKDLPFAKQDDIFEKGCWASGGWGVDRGETHYDGGGSSSNGITVFKSHENKIIDDILSVKSWIKEIPTTVNEAFSLYDEGNYTQSELVTWITAK